MIQVLKQIATGLLVALDLVICWAVSTAGFFWFLEDPGAGSWLGLALYFVAGNEFIDKINDFKKWLLN